MSFSDGAPQPMVCVPPAEYGKEPLARRRSIDRGVGSAIAVVVALYGNISLCAKRDGLAAAAGIGDEPLAGGPSIHGDVGLTVAVVVAWNWNVAQCRRTPRRIAASTG